jgi:hypothetical protein
MSERSLRYDAAHPEMKRLRQKRYREKIRHEAIVAYGSCCCDCGTTSEAKLEFDHVDGHGNEHRSKVFGYGHASPGGWNFYRWLKQSGYPQDLRLVLRCTDCHDLRHPERISKERRRAPAQSHDDLPYDDKVPF